MLLLKNLKKDIRVRVQSPHDLSATALNENGGFEQPLLHLYYIQAIKSVSISWVFFW